MGLIAKLEARIKALEDKLSSGPTEMPPEPEPEPEPDKAETPPEA